LQELIGNGGVAGNHLGQGNQLGTEEQGARIQHFPVTNPQISTQKSISTYTTLQSREAKIISLHANIYYSCLFLNQPFISRYLLVPSWQKGVP
jgi:hypothetical protein